MTEEQSLLQKDCFHRLLREIQSLTKQPGKHLIKTERSIKSKQNQNKLIKEPSSKIKLKSEIRKVYQTIAGSPKILPITLTQNIQSNKTQKLSEMKNILNKDFVRIDKTKIMKPTIENKIKKNLMKENFQRKKEEQEFQKEFNDHVKMKPHHSRNYSFNNVNYKLPNTNYYGYSQTMSAVGKNLTLTLELRNIGSSNHIKKILSNNNIHHSPTRFTNTILPYAYNSLN